MTTTPEFRKPTRPAHISDEMLAHIRSTIRDTVWVHGDHMVTLEDLLDLIEHQRAALRRIDHLGSEIAVALAGSEVIPRG